MMRKLFVLFCFLIFSNPLFAQIDQSKTGAWYMYFFNHQFNNSQFGIQGDLQYRNWNTIGDLEQLLVRTGLTYTPKDSGVLLQILQQVITEIVMRQQMKTEFTKKHYYLKK